MDKLAEEIKFFQTSNRLTRVSYNFAKTVLENFKNRDTYTKNETFKSFLLENLFFIS